MFEVTIVGFTMGMIRANAGYGYGHVLRPDTRTRSYDLESTPKWSNYFPHLDGLPAKISKRPEYAILAKLLTEARESVGLSQSELARRLGKRQAYIWKLENAQRTPDLVELMDWAEATGTSSAEIAIELSNRKQLRH